MENSAELKYKKIRERDDANNPFALVTLKCQGLYIKQARQYVLMCVPALRRLRTECISFHSAYI